MATHRRPSWDEGTNPGMVAPSYEHTMRQIEKLVETLLPEGQMLYHLDVVVATRSVTDATQGDFRRFPAPGADPLLSMGALLATLDELRVRLNPNLDLRRN